MNKITHKDARQAYSRAYERPVKVNGKWTGKAGQAAWRKRSFACAVIVAKCVAINDAIRELWDQEGLDGYPETLPLTDTMTDDRRGHVIARDYINNWIEELHKCGEE